jgi:hypothetical protein
MSLEEILFFASPIGCWSLLGARAHIARGRPEDRDHAQRMLKQGEETAGRLVRADHAGSPGGRAVLAAIGG